MLPYLRQCHASIMDQGVACEHIIMDGGSTDGTAEWMSSKDDVKGVSERDRGMYNALNKAIDQAGGEFIGHLNADEQYLPGTLQAVLDFFDHHPDVDFVAGNFLVVDPRGELIAYRKTFQPRWPYFFSNYLYTTTCVLFYRRRVFEHLRFDEQFRSIADVIFVYQVMRHGFRSRHLDQYFSTFTYSGDNLSLNPISQLEKDRFWKTLPIWFRACSLFIKGLFFFEKILHGNYREKSPLRYAIYSAQNWEERTTREVVNPHFRLHFEANAARSSS
jgi:glycosyltransferase involved in cell wall biosynthesis